ncbi:MAG: alkane 1-monooxygenase [Pseudomonadota bacterium]
MWWHYLKFFHYFVTTFIGIACIIAGGNLIILGFLLFIGIYVFGDSFLGDDLSRPRLQNKTFINCLLYLSVPLTALLFMSMLWLVSSFNFGIFAFVSQYLPVAIVETKLSTNFIHIVFAILFLGFLVSGTATVVAHEFVHRINSPIDTCLGRWLMALSFDANFSIEHVYNHHAKVATDADPVSAPRGRNVYTHFVKAVIGTNKSSWQIEAKRLKQKQLKLFSFHNRCLRGYMMSITLAVLAVSFASWQGLLMFIAVGVSAKFILEVVNYMEHYGLVRLPTARVRPAHSWNSNRKVSNWTMFNLPRHSHHHANASVPFQRLHPMAGSPTMISGYITTIFIALIPPLWFRLMAPKLEEWDAKHATPEELTIIADQEQLMPRSFVAKLIY